MIDDEDSSFKISDEGKKNAANLINEEMIDDTNFNEMPFQKHSSLLGNIIEKIDNHQ